MKIKYNFQIIIKIYNLELKIYLLKYFLFLTNMNFIIIN